MLHWLVDPLYLEKCHLVVTLLLNTTGLFFLVALTFFFFFCKGMDLQSTK